MSHSKWKILGSTLVASAMLVGCGGDSGPADPLSNTDADATSTFDAPVAVPVADPAPASTPAPPVAAPAPAAATVTAASPSRPVPPIRTASKARPAPPVTAPKPYSFPTAAPHVPPVVIAPVGPVRPVTTAPLPSVPAIHIAPLPCVPAVSIPPLPVVPTTAAAPHPSALIASAGPGGRGAAAGTSKISSGVARSAADADSSSRKNSDFTGAINTYPAISVFKFLIQSMGPEALLAHFSKMKSADFPGENDSLASMLHLATYLARHSVSAQVEVNPTFSRWIEAWESCGIPLVVALGEAKQLYLDAYENHHMEKLASGDLSLVKKSIDSHGKKFQQEESRILHLLRADRNGMDLQALVDSFAEISDPHDSSEYEFQVSDEKSLKKINFMVAIAKGSKPDQLHFDGTVKLPVVNKITGRKFFATVSLENLVFNDEKSGKMTHYHVRDKYYEKSYSYTSRWKNNWERVLKTPSREGEVYEENLELFIKEKGYPAFVSFSVLKIEPAQ